MNVKYTHLLSAIEHLKSEAGLYNAESSSNVVIDVNVAEDNPGEGKLVECLTLKCTMVKEPGRYDEKSQVTREWTIEVFSEGENRLPRSVCVKSQDINIPNGR